MCVHKSSGCRSAVKSLSLVNMTARQSQLLYNEVSIYLSLDHPNITRLIEVYEDEAAIHLVMELCTGRELYERLCTNRRYTEEQGKKVVYEMLSAINYCHQHCICHRDLKLENWVYSNVSEDAPVKLIDFGFARIFTPGVPMTAMHGTVYYVSPEVMDGCYREKCDIWSIGVIAYMLLSGSPPFNGSYDHEILVKIKRAAYSFQGPRWQGVSPEAIDFISKLLKKDPEQRMSAASALQHPWLRQRASRPVAASILSSMLSFSSKSVLRRATLGLVAFSVNSDVINELAQEFHELDRFGTGTIAKETIIEVLSSQLGIAAEQALDVFHKMDLTGNGEVQYSEFLAATLEAKIELDQALIRSAFQKLDIEHCGRIKTDSLRAVIGGKEELPDVETMDFEQFAAAVRLDSRSHAEKEVFGCEVKQKLSCPSTSPSTSHPYPSSSSSPPPLPQISSACGSRSGPSSPVSLSPVQPPTCSIFSPFSSSCSSSVCSSSSSSHSSPSSSPYAVRGPRSVHLSSQLHPTLPLSPPDKAEANI